MKRYALVISTRHQAHMLVEATDEAEAEEKALDILHEEGQQWGDIEDIQIEEVE